MADVLRRHVLLVEDNPADVNIFKIACSDFLRAHDLAVVADGEAALKFLHRRERFHDVPRPDLVILDLNLPRISGMEVLHHMKSDDRLRMIPVVVFSNSNNERDVQEAYHSHAACYIKKPVSVEDMERICRDLHGFWLDLVRLPPEAPSPASVS